MKKIPFDIKYRPEIEAGEYKVVTRDELPVRIICWDRNSIEYPIVALVKSKCGEETAMNFGKKGNFFTDLCDNDLFLITPEPELTSWQTFISGCLQKYGLLDCGAADRIAKECSAELLELARKELNRTIGDYGQGYSDGYIDGKKVGKSEALKDLPRWIKFDAGICDNWQYRVVLTEEGPVLYDQIWRKGIRIKDLEELPKEDKK